MSNCARHNSKMAFKIPDSWNNLYNLFPFRVFGTYEYDESSFPWLGNFMWQKWKDRTDVIKVPNQLTLNI